MKKTYMKPALYVESFGLTQSIASNCTAQNIGLGEANHAMPQVCGWKINDAIYFTAGVNAACEAGEIEIVCYNAPNGNIMFES